MFYINYEECKSKVETLRKVSLSCFILTMRNVNFDVLSVSCIIIYLFYINYEECKFLNHHLLHLKHLSFILTMRNVNISKSVTLNSFIIVLY